MQFIYYVIINQNKNEKKKVDVITRYGWRMFLHFFFSGKTYFLLNMFKKILNIFIKNSEVMLKILILIIINYSFHISIEHIYMNLSLKTNPIVEIIPKGLNFWTNVFR